MKPRLLCTILAGALLTTGGVAAAQTPDPVLNQLEVRRLVAAAEPADHARLRDHFAALADEYTADAKRQKALSRGFAGNPNRTWAVKPGAHAARLADLARDSAAMLRELAAFHGSLANGRSAVRPDNRGRFEDGEGAPAPTAAELRMLAAAARTPADHYALEEYFATLAAKHNRVADAHAAIVVSYRATPRRTLSGDPAGHCENLVKVSRDAAAEAGAAAALHRQLANIG